MIAAAIADTRTAPAAVSFAIFANGFFSLVTRSTAASNAVFTSSSDRIRPNYSKQMHHSTGLI